MYLAFAWRQELRYSFFDLEDLRAWSAEVRLAALDAEGKLAELELHEELAELWETETCATLRDQFAQRYRERIGVLPNQRGALRAALHRVYDGGGMPVADVISLLSARQASNGSDDDGGPRSEA